MHFEQYRREGNWHFKDIKAIPATMQFNEKTNIIEKIQLDNTSGNIF